MNLSRILVQNLLDTIENVQDAFASSLVVGSSRKTGETDAFSFSVEKLYFKDISADPIPYGVKSSGGSFGFEFPNMTLENVDISALEEVTTQVYIVKIILLFSLQDL